MSFSEDKGRHIMSSIIKETSVHDSRHEFVFRQVVRDFLAESLPADMAHRNLGVTYSCRDDTLRWTSILASRGWSVPQWPKDVGGTGWSPLERHWFDEECFMAGAPRPNVQATGLVGPVVYTFGNEQQIRRHLPDIVNGRVIWAQGFSEPDAGSDLASLRTRAVRDGDFFVVNGQKIWTTQAYMSDMIFCLVRTNSDVKPQKGISFLLIPANAAGVTIRRIPSIDGGAHLCETFFEDVRVPADHLVGEEGAGWTYAKFLLGSERTMVAELPRNKYNLAALRKAAGSTFVDGHLLLDDPEFAGRLARLEIDFLALESAVLNDLSGKVMDELVASSIKIRGTELLQAVSELAFEAMGSVAAIDLPEPSALPTGDFAVLPVPEWAAKTMSDLLYSRATTIYGGTTEVQKNILSKGILRRDAVSANDWLSEEQCLIRESARKFAQTRSYSTNISPSDADLKSMRREFGSAGWLGLSVPEHAGGVGATPADNAVLLEELGRHLILEPSQASSILVSEILLAAGTSEPGVALLAAHIAGETTIAVAYDEAEAGGTVNWLSTMATASNHGWTLDGQKVLVLGAETADHLVIWARTAGKPGAVCETDSTLFLVETSRPGILYHHYRLIDGRHASNITFSSVELDPADIVGTQNNGFPIMQRALEHATIAACAEALGVMDAALWITRDYLLTRKQFGQRLADFQALQHHLADIFVKIGQSRDILRMATDALMDEDATKRIKLVSAAKVTLGRIAKTVGAQFIQLHGGIGMTSEYSIGRYYKALLVFETLFGNEARHLAHYRIASR